MFDLLDDIPVGIDLGTTNSCICYWNGKEVKTIPNRIGERTTPSVVYFLNNSEEYLIGEQIQKYLSTDYQKIYSVKRIIGRDFRDKKLEKEIKLLHYDIENVSGRPMIPIIQKGKKKIYSPEEISSLIIKKLVKDAENLLNTPIEKIVISVPAYFDDAQRNATLEAAKLAGLKVIRIINEPTAAALSYGLGQNFCPFKKESPSLSDEFRKNREKRRQLALQNSFCLIDKEDKYSTINNNNINHSYSEKGKNIMVFDLGGGTYDLAVLQLNLEAKEYQVKSKYSDKYLGGDDFDNQLIDYCLNKSGFNRNRDNIDNISMKRLRNACEFAKKILSQREEATIQVDNFKEKRDIQTRVQRKEFEDEICKDLFDKLSEPFDQLFQGAKLTKNDIDEVILVGGSTRMPKIKEILGNIFTCPIIEEISPDEVVAFGATIQAAMLMTIGKNKILDGVKLFDITPISLGTDVINRSNDERIKALGNKMSVIIPKWTKIPIIKEKNYKTIHDNQETMQICIYEGENDYLKDNKLLGNFTLVNLPKKPKGVVNCTVKFEINANNVLNVTAFETSTGINKKIEVVCSKNVHESRASIGELTMSQISEEKNKFDYDISKYIENYQKAKNIDQKIKILENYNEIIKRAINDINPSEEEKGINGNNINIYFFYVYQLFESYEEMLYLLNSEKKNHSLNDNILDNIHKYINIFKKQNIYYIKQFIDLFKDTEQTIFVKIFYYSIKNFNEMGQYFIDNVQKFSRYYAKLYFEEVINLENKYNVRNKEGLCGPGIMSEIKEELKKSELRLAEINSNAIALINKAEKEKQLIEPLSNDLNKSIPDGWGSGFTFLKKKVNIDNKFLEYDEYNLILDELEKICSELKLLINKSPEEKKNDLIEKQSICLGNIVKIKFSYLKGQKYNDDLKLIKQCLFNAEKCKKNNSETKWYQDALKLKKEIEEAKIASEKEISSNIEKILNNIDDLFNKENKMEFINYILDNAPYKGYNKNTRPPFYNWDVINKELIEFLAKQYHPDSYPQETQEEIANYRIIESISKKLNNLLEGLTPKDPSYVKKTYILK